MKTAHGWPELPPRGKWSSVRQASTDTIPQPSLFDAVPQRTRNTDPATSLEAERKLRDSGKLTEQCRATLVALAAWTGDAPTSAELACGDVEARYRHARRLADLETLGLVEKREPRVCRATGNKAATWVVTELGREALG